MSQKNEITVEEMLMQNRVVFLPSNINSMVATSVIMRLIFLESQKPGQEINLYINSNGGNPDDCLSIIDCMNHISSKITTCCIGQAVGGAALILASGNKRIGLPHCKVVIHDVYGSATGQATDIDLAVKNVKKTKKVINGILAKSTNKTVEEIDRMTERQFSMNAEEAKEFGFIDDIATPKKKK